MSVNVNVNVHAEVHVFVYTYANMGSWPLTEWGVLGLAISDGKSSQFKPQESPTEVETEMAHALEETGSGEGLGIG